MLRIIATMLYTISALLLAFLGYQYDTIGFGLNPMAAYPLATLCFVAPIAMTLAERK